MTLPLADWYDDPEDPTLLRYWDGAAWTDDRRPKILVPRPRATDFGDVFGDTYALARKMVLPSLAVFALGFITVVAILVAFFVSLGDSTGDDIAPAVIAAIVIIFVIGVVAAAVASLGWIRLAAARYNGVKLTIGDALRGGIRRIPRALLFLLVFSGVASVAMLVIAVLSVLVPPLLFLFVPAAIGALIWLWPHLTLVGVVIAAGPNHPGPFTTIRDVIGARWGFLAGRILVFNIVMFLAAIALQIFSVAGGAGGTEAAIVVLVINVVAHFFLSLYQYCMPVVLYAMANGPLDPELTQSLEPPDTASAL